MGTVASAGTWSASATEWVWLEQLTQHWQIKCPIDESPHQDRGPLVLGLPPAQRPVTSRFLIGTMAELGWRGRGEGARQASSFWRQDDLLWESRQCWSGNGNLGGKLNLEQLPIPVSLGAQSAQAGSPKFQQATLGECPGDVWGPP